MSFGDDPVSFDTTLAPDQEAKFQTWKAANAPKDSGADYDLRGAFQAGVTRSDNGHFPDTFKKPNHPTFSNQSKYAAIRPDLAGSWNGETYVPAGGPANPFGDQAAPDVPRRTNRATLAGLFGGVDSWDGVVPKDAINAVDASLSGLTDKKAGRMRAANIALLSDRFGKSPDEISGMYNQFKDSFASQTLKTAEPLDDAAFYTKAGAYLKQQGEETKMLGGVVAGVFAGVKEGGASFNEVYSKLEAANSAAPGWDKTKADYYRTVARQQWEQFQAKSKQLAGPIATVSAFMKEAAAGVVPGQEDALMGRHDAVISLLSGLNPEDASTVMEFAAGTAKKSTKKKGFLESTANALDEGISKLGTNFVGAGQELGRRIGGAIAGGSGGAFAAGEDRRKAQIVRELDQHISGEVDPIKGDNFVENMALKTAEAIPTLASFMSLPGIIANGLATKEELRGQYEDGGLSANAADALSAVTAVPMTAINFVSSKMVFGKVPGAGKLFDPIATLSGVTLKGLAKRAAAVAGVELPTQLGLAEIQQALPSGTQALASAMSEQVPEVHWDKVFAGMGKALPETLTSVIPLVLMGTGTAVFKDRAAGLAYLKNEARLTALGIQPQAKAAIMAESSPETAQAILSKALDNADPSTPAAAAAVETLNAQAIDAHKAVVGVDHPTVAVPEAQKTTELLDKVSAMTPDEYFTWAQGHPEGGQTMESFRVGISLIGNEAGIADLKARQATVETQIGEIKDKVAKGGADVGELLDAQSALSAKRQFFREAIEAAENTGSAATEPIVQQAHERAGTLPRSAIEGENPNPTEPLPAEGGAAPDSPEALAHAKTPEEWATFDNSLARIDRQAARLEGGQQAEKRALAIQRLELQAEAGIPGATEALGQFHEKIAAAEAAPDVDTAIKRYVQEHPLLSPTAKEAEGHVMAGELRKLGENLSEGQKKQVFRQDGAADFDKYAQHLADHLEAEGLQTEGSGMSEAELLDRIAQAFNTKREPVPVPRIESPAPGASILAAKISRSEAGNYIVSDGKGEVVGTAQSPEMAAQIAIDHNSGATVAEPVPVAAPEAGKPVQKPAEVTQKPDAVDRGTPDTPNFSANAPDIDGKEDPNTAALNKATIKSVRKVFDLESLPKPERQAFETVLAESRDAASVADGLAEEVIANPRELDAHEHASMVIRAAELQNTYETLMNEAARDMDAGLPIFGEAKRRQAEGVLEALDRLTEASDRAGTEIGRALSIRRMRINRTTFELASVIQRATVAKRGKLTAEQTEEFRKLSESIKEQQSKIDSLEKDLAEERLKVAKKDAETFVSEGRSVRATAGRMQNAKRRMDLKKELVAMGLRVNDITSSFGQGAEVAAIVAKMARTYIEDGAATLSEVSEKLRKDLPELTDSDIYNSLGGRIKSEQKRIEGEAKARVRELTKQALLLAKIGDGLKQEKLGKKPSKDSPVVKALREQLAQLRLQADRSVTEDARLKSIHEKINEVQDQLATGARPDPVAEKAAESEKVAAARKQLKDLITERELVDRIDELDKQVKAGVADVQAAPEPAKNARLEQLRAQRDELRSKLSDIGAPERTAEAMIQRMAERQAGAETFPETKRNALRDAVAEQNRNPVDDEAFNKKLTGLGLNEVQADTLAKLVRNDIEAADTARAIAEEDRTNPEKVNARRKDALELKIKDVESQLAGGFRTIPEKSSKVSNSVDVAGLKKSLDELQGLMRTQDAISDLQEQIRTGDFKVSAPERRVIKNAKLADAYVTKKQLEREVRQRIEALKPKSFKDKVVDVLLLPRSVLATADMSATLRQGAFLSARRPIVAAKAFARSFGAFLSQNTADAIDIAIRNHPNQIERQRAKLFLSDLDQALNIKEESFVSNLAARIPGFGRLVQASERSMVTTLNLLRAASFDQFITDHPDATPEQRKAFASYVNVASGRGDLGRFNNAAKELGAVFFAPRFAVSRFQLLYSPFKNIHDPIVRKEIAKDFLAFGVTGMTVLGLAAAAGAKVGTDPESPDFGKIVLGHLHLDIWGGLQQPMRLLMQPVLAGLDKVGLHESKPPVDLLDAGRRFLSYKLAPSVTIPTTLLTGKNVIGQPEEASETLLRSITPLLAQDMFEAFQDTQSLTEAGAAGALSFVGVGVSTQKPKKK